jgi:hypothetical protein
MFITVPNHVVGMRDLRPNDCVAQNSTGMSEYTDNCCA